MSSNKVILGLLGGLAAGAALGILFAPQSGKKTRRALMRKGEHMKDDLGDLIERGHENWSKLRNKASDAVSMTKEEVEDFVRYLFNEAREQKDDTTADTEASSNGRRKAAAH